MIALTGFRTLVWREIYRFLSVFFQTVVPPVVSSFLYIFIFGYSIGRRIDHIGEFTYLEFLVPGLIMMYVIEGSYTNTSSSLFISRWANYIEELLVTPLSFVEMVFAMLMGGLARSLFTAAGVFAVSLLFSPTIPENPLIVFYFMVFVSLTFSSLGLLVALLAEDWEHLGIMSTFVITPLIFLGGVFHSLDMVPATLRSLTQFNPIFYMISGMRYGFLGSSDAPVGQCMLVIFLLFLSLFLVTVYLFKIGFKLRK